MRSAQSTPTVEPDRDVGMFSLLTPTHDWLKPAPGPFHWVVWLPRSEGGTWKVAGFSTSRWGAASDILDVRVAGWPTPEGWVNKDGRQAA